MSTVTERIDALVSETRELASMVGTNIADRENDPRSMCFWNIHNQAVMAREVVGFYENVWKGEEGTEDEMLDRMISATRNLFVNVMSSIEKGARDCMRIYKTSEGRSRAMEKGGRMYLRDILVASGETGLLEDNDRECWKKIMMMRNLVVHNNAVSDRSDILELGELKISMRPDRMMKGPVSTYVILSSMASMMFYRWLTAMDRSQRWSREISGKSSITRIREHGGAPRPFRYHAWGGHWTSAAGTGRPFLP